MVDVEEAVRDALRSRSALGGSTDELWADVRRRIQRRARRRRLAVGSVALVVLGAASATIATTTGDSDDPARSQVIQAGPGPVTTVPPESNDDGAVDEPEWREIEPPSIEAREGASVTPAGDKVILWGGAPFGRDAPTDSRTGLAFYPTPLQWAGIAEAPFSTRVDHVAVWTGREVIVWGGRAPGDGTAYVQDGAAYDPAAGTWRTIAPAPLPPDRYSAAWTGSEMIVLGGGEATVTGAAYNPTTDTWRPIAPPPIALVAFDLAVNGGDVLVVGAQRTGEATAQQFHALAYDPATDSWTDLGGQAATSTEIGMTASDDRLVVWGDDGRDPTWQLDLATGVWTSGEPFPTGCEAIGPAAALPGAAIAQRCDSLYRYNLDTGVWFDLDAPTDRWIVVGDQVFMPS